MKTAAACLSRTFVQISGGVHLPLVSAGFVAILVLDIVELSTMFKVFGVAEVG